MLTLQFDENKICRPQGFHPVKKNHGLINYWIWLIATLPEVSVDLKSDGWSIQLRIHVQYKTFLLAWKGSHFGHTWVAKPQEQVTKLIILI